MITRVRLAKKKIDPKEYASRECYSCGKVGIQRGKCFLNPPTNLYLCENCYSRLFLNKSRREYQKRTGRDKWRGQILGKHISFKQEPRIGVCNYCRAVRGIDCKRTSLHHDDNIYDIRRPLWNTIELCSRCHQAETMRLWGCPPLLNMKFLDGPS